MSFAKQHNYNVTAEVTVHHLIFTENRILEIGTDVKCAPPLRTETDRLALIGALKEGIIDCVVTDHAPHTVVLKRKKLEDAPFGVIGLETALSALYSLVEKKFLSINDIVGVMSEKPARIVGLQGLGSIVPGNAGDLVIFDPKAVEEIKPPFVSKSENSPFKGSLFSP
jgi:dihydroorotase